MARARPRPTGCAPGADIQPLRSASANLVLPFCEWPAGRTKAESAEARNQGLAGVDLPAPAAGNGAFAAAPLPDPTEATCSRAQRRATLPFGHSSRAESGRGRVPLRRKVARAFHHLVYASLGFRFHPLRSQKEMKQ